MCGLLGFTKRCSRRIKFKILFVLAVLFVLTRIYKPDFFNNVESSNSKEILSQEDNVNEDIFDYMANKLKVHFVFLSLAKAQITISNDGSRDIKNSGWAIYFSLGTKFLPHLPWENNTDDNNMIFSHVIGQLYKLKPVLESMPPGSSLKCIIEALPIMLWTRTMVSPNWYIAENGLKPRVIVDTANEDLSFVSSTETLNQNHGSVVSVTDLEHAPLVVIPTPKKIMTSGESARTVSVTKEWTVSGDDRLQNEVKFLSGKLGLKVSSFNTKSKTILLTLMESSPGEQFSTAGNESYNLQVDGSKQFITITGTGPAGVFYGVQTLLALINDRGEVSQVSIEDSPRFSYRGLMVDVARNFKPKDEILKLLDVMAMYKMNKFHFHLSDSEGWRLEIPGLDELTRVGARRCHDLQEKTCIMSQLGSGPYDTSTSGTGHYSTEDYREILRHATQRHIQVIPEFDFPRHSHAAIKSMIARHDRLVQQGNEREAKNFLLTDLDDKSQYSTPQGFSDDVINPCMNSTYNFIEYLLSTLLRLHGDIQPLTFFHFGGDEVPNRVWVDSIRDWVKSPGVWVDSPECHKMTYAFNGSRHFTKRVLMEHFIQTLIHITQKYGLNIGAWADAFTGRDGVVLNRETLTNKGVVAYFWGSIQDRHQDAYNLIRNGYKVVFSTPKYFYFDHSQEPHFDERGLNWAAKNIDIRTTFGYSPFDNQNVLGLEGAMWGELVRTADQMNGMIFPRLLALAERAWHKASWEDLEGRERYQEINDDWVKFANTLGYRELGRLDKMGVAYRVPPPIAKVVYNKLHVTTELPGLKVEFSTDDGLTWNDVTAETEVNSNIKLRTRSVDQNRFSRVIRLDRTPWW